MASSIHLHASSFVDREDHLKSLAFIKCSHKKLFLLTACPYISTDPDLRHVPDMDFRDCKIARSHKSLMMVQMICGLFCKKRRQMLLEGRLTTNTLVASRNVGCSILQWMEVDGCCLCSCRRINGWLSVIWVAYGSKHLKCWKVSLMMKRRLYIPYTLMN